MSGLATTFVRVSLTRAIRSRRATAIVACWVAFGLAAALVARLDAVPTGASHVLRGAVGPYFVPLLAYAVVGAMLGGTGLRRSIRGLVTLGAAPRAAALASASAAIATSAVLAFFVGGLACVIAHGAADPALGRDALASAWVSGLGAAAYASLFVASSVLGAGGGRTVLLFLDWIAGGTALGVAFLPRAHLASLLGGPLAADLSPRASCLALVASVLAYLGLAVGLSRRA